MLRLIEIAEGRSAGLWEPLLVLIVLAFTLVAPRRTPSGAPIRYGLIRFLLFTYFPVYLLSLSLNSWGQLGATLHFFARLTMAIAYIRLALFLFLDVMIPRMRGVPTSRIVTDIVHGIVYIVGVLWLLKGAGLDALSLLTTGTVLGAIIGLSLQETLGNIFAGLAVQTEEPFTVGDWISLEGMNLVGQVLEVNWRATLIKTEDEEQINIPNAVIARTPIRNFNAPDPAFEVELPFTVPYHISPTQVRQIAVAAAKQVTWVDHRPPACGVEGFDDQGIKYRLRFYSRHMAQRREQISEVFENLWSGLAERSIPIGFPVREVRHFAVRPPGDEGDEEQNARLAALAALDFFSPLSLEDRRRLASRLEVRAFTAGQPLTQQGANQPCCFIVVSGTLTARCLEAPAPEETSPPSEAPDDEGGEAAEESTAPTEAGTSAPSPQAVPEAKPAPPQEKEATFGPGDYFGELTLLTGEPQPTTVIADGDVKTYVLRQDMLDDVLGHSQPAVLEAIGHKLAMRCGVIQNEGDGPDAQYLPSRGLVEVQILDRMRRLFRLR